MINSLITDESINDIPYNVDAPEKITRIPNRPLGLLSDYVTSELSADLSEGKPASYFIDQSEKLASQTDCNEVADEDVSLALLDVTMLESAIRQCSKKEDHAQSAGNVFKQLLHDLAERRGIIPQLSYEGLIFANPIDSDPRSFLSGDIGRQELMFYKMHALIEQEFFFRLPAISELVQSQKITRAPLPIEQLSVALDEIHELLISITHHMHQLKTVVSREAFNKMRPFFAPSESYTGPSGKFSSGYFMMDSLLNGCDPAFVPLLKSKLYELYHYPNTSLMKDGFAGQDDMINAFATVQRGNDLVALCRKTGDDEIEVRLHKVLALAEVNRNVHIGLAKRFLNAEYSNGGSGTGDKSPLKEYLEKFRDVYSLSLHQS